eukprot:3432966-Pyramimonas_sp.AAC.1
MSTEAATQGQAHASDETCNETEDGQRSDAPERAHSQRAVGGLLGQRSQPWPNRIEYGDGAAG